MENNVFLIPGGTNNRPQQFLPPPKLKNRVFKPWMKQAIIALSVISIALVIFIEVVNPLSSSGSDSTKTTGFNASVAMYALTYASHCDAGSPIIVQQGDTLASLAAKYHVSVSALAATNGISVNEVLVAGEAICPAASNASAPVILGTTSLEPCQSTNYWLPVISGWAIPPGCYGYVYSPNPNKYPYRPAWGWCNWWPEEMHPNLQGDAALHLPKHSVPIVGATVWFDPYEQGASSEGHYAEVVAINPDNYWILISEMNDNWRGAGWGKVDYRYIHISPGVQFLY